MQTFLSAILFLCFIALITILVVTGKKAAQEKNAAKIKEKYRRFWSMVRGNMTQLIPGIERFDLIIAQGIKDAKATRKGYERLMTGYEVMPAYILCFKEYDLYLSSVKTPSLKQMNPDPNFLLHASVLNVGAVETGFPGKVEFYFKDTKRFIAMSVEAFLIPGLDQTEEYEKFNEFLTNFSERLSLE